MAPVIDEEGLITHIFYEEGVTDESIITPVIHNAGTSCNTQACD